uniref:Centromere protein S n=1 Tax=Arion vulgaris TaxID=1028688 RepID=A0A0B7B530_9EUPU
MNTDYDKLDKEQSLKAAMYYSVKQIAKEVEEEMEVRVSAGVLATLSESLSRQVEVYAMDLENFAKHAKRTQINVDDVRLLTRRNTTLHQHLDSISGEKTGQQAHKKKAKKTVKKSSHNEIEDSSRD